jgi:hypothetical protein
MARPSFSRFVYCDTNILSQLAKHQELWPPLSQSLLEYDLTLAVGGQVAKLADAPRLLESLAALLTAVPAAIIKQWDVILDEEVSAHPGMRHETLLSYPLDALLLQDGRPTTVGGVSLIGQPSRRQQGTIGICRATCRPSQRIEVELSSIRLRDVYARTSVAVCVDANHSMASNEPSELS